MRVARRSFVFRVESHDKAVQRWRVARSAADGHEHKEAQRLTHYVVPRSTHVCRRIAQGDRHTLARKRGKESGASAQRTATRTGASRRAKAARRALHTVRPSGWAGARRDAPVRRVPCVHALGTWQKVCVAGEEARASGHGGDVCARTGRATTSYDTPCPMGHFMPHAGAAKCVRGSQAT